MSSDFNFVFFQFILNVYIDRERERDRETDRQTDRDLQQVFHVSQDNLKEMGWLMMCRRV